MQENPSSVAPKEQQKYMTSWCRCTDLYDASSCAGPLPHVCTIDYAIYLVDAGNHGPEVTMRLNAKSR